MNKFEKKYIPFIEQALETLLIKDRRDVVLTKKELNGNTLATVNTNYPYKDLKIDYSPELESKTDEIIKDTLLHEVVHVLTDPLYCKATNRFVSEDEINDERESLTDHITVILLKNNVIKRNNKRGKKTSPRR